MKSNTSINDLLLLDSELAVKWNDDSETFIPLKTLRVHCPCARCSGETDVFGDVFQGPEQKLGESAYQAINIEKVGHYALRIFWGDNHADGLYTYNMLRTLANI